jgi:RNA polymerase sigma factor (sigma-70 family)
VSAALLKTQSDARLSVLAADGYEAALETLIARYRRPLQRYARRFLTEGLAEDVVQQAFMDLWATLSSGEEIRCVRAWLYRVVRNAALNTIRRASYRSEEAPEGVELDSPELAFERSSTIREALTGLASLPAMQREVLMRSAVDGHSRTQIGLAMGLTDGAVGQMLYRARSSVRSAMSAIVPLPLAASAARGVGCDVSTAARMLQLTSTSAGGGPAGMLFRGGATLAMIAAVSAAPVVATHARPHHGHPALSAAVAIDAGLLLPGASNPLQAFPPARAAGGLPSAQKHAPAQQPQAKPASASASSAPAEPAPAEAGSPEESSPPVADTAPVAEESLAPASEATPETAPVESSPAPEAAPAEPAPSAGPEAAEAPPAEAAPPAAPEAAAAPA